MDAQQRQMAYRALFKAVLNDDQLLDIRIYLQQSAQSVQIVSKPRLKPNLAA
jgi:hypothetical protein